jgi:hypothetical protein
MDGWSSEMGMVSGAPYVAHVDEKTTGMVSKLRSV